MNGYGTAGLFRSHARQSAAPADQKIEFHLTSPCGFIPRRVAPMKNAGLSAH